MKYTNQAYQGASQSLKDQIARPLQTIEVFTHEQV